MHRALGQPPIMLVYNWPAVPPMVVIASHEVAEQVSKPSNTFQYSAPKSWSVDRLVDLIGSKSIMFKQVEAQIPATNIHCANKIERMMSGKLYERDLTLDSLHSI